MLLWLIHLTHCLRFVVIFWLAVAIMVDVIFIEEFIHFIKQFICQDFVTMGLLELHLFVEVVFLIQI